MACKICETAKKEGFCWFEHIVVRLDMYGDACLTAKNGVGMYGSEQISYCPFCGEKLNEGGDVNVND